MTAGHWCSLSFGLAAFVAAALNLVFRWNTSLPIWVILFLGIIGMIVGGMPIWKAIYSLTKTSLKEP